VVAGKTRPWVLLLNTPQVPISRCVSFAESRPTTRHRQCGSPVRVSTSQHGALGFSLVGTDHWGNPHYNPYKPLGHPTQENHVCSNPRNSPLDICDARHSARGKLLGIHHVRLQSSTRLRYIWRITGHITRPKTASKSASHQQCPLRTRVDRQARLQSPTFRGYHFPRPSSSIAASGLPLWSSLFSTASPPHTTRPSRAALLSGRPAPFICL
jgi:hypothetical protein